MVPRAACLPAGAPVRPMPDATHPLRSRADAAEQKLLGLELLRFLSAVAVLVWHYQHFWFVGPELAQNFVRREQPLYPFFHLFYEWGVYGVQVFWFISGYIFFWKYLGAIGDGRVGAWRFFVLRASRLYPLHLLTFLLVAALQFAYRAQTGHFHVYAWNDAYHAVLQLFMASNWGLEKGSSYNGPIWSVSLEVLAYLAFFVFARRFGLRGGTSGWVVVTVIASAISFQLTGVPLFQCLFCFFVGGLAVLWGRTDVARAHGRAILIASLAWIVGMALAGQALHLFDRKIVVHLYIVSATPLLIHLLATHARFPPAWARGLAVAGNTTYSSYLLHFPLQMGFMLAAALTGWRIPREEPAFFLAYLGLSIALGVVAFRAFEMPMQNGLRRLAGYQA